MTRRKEPIRDPEKTREYIDWCMRQRIKELIVEAILRATAGD